MDFAVKVLALLLAVWMAFPLRRMIVKGATAGGIARRGQPAGYTLHPLELHSPTEMVMP